MKFILLLLISSLVTLYARSPGGTNEVCGRVPTAQRHIGGGRDAGFNTVPWQAFVKIDPLRFLVLTKEIFRRVTGIKQSYCGGSLISWRHVVTAGHCVAQARPSHVRVTLGENNINAAAQSFPLLNKFGVWKIQVHPKYQHKMDTFDRFDVAVLLLSKNVHTFMPDIVPICLPEPGSDFVGQTARVAGWGVLSSETMQRPDTLQVVDIPVVDSRQCEKNVHRAKGTNDVIYDEMLCAGYSDDGKYACYGDSGGPLMVEREGLWYLIGVVSGGIPPCGSTPNIFHRVANTVDWIKRQL